MIFFRGLYLALALALISQSLLPAFAQELPRGRYIYDNANMISADVEAELEQKLLSLDKKTSVEIVVFTLPKLSGHGIKDKSGVEIRDYKALAVFIFNEMSLPNGDGRSVIGIGKKTKDNGVLLLVTGGSGAQAADRKWKIEVGYGLEGNLTDLQAGDIGEEYLVPFLQEDDYENAFSGTVDALVEQVSGGQVLSSEEPALGNLDWLAFLFAALGLPNIAFLFPSFLNTDSPYTIIIIVIIVAIVLFSLGLRRGGFGGGWRGGRSGGGGGRSGGGGAGGGW